MDEIYVDVSDKLSKKNADDIKELKNQTSDTKKDVDNVTNWLTGSGEVAQEFVEKATQKVKDIGEDVISGTKEIAEDVKNWVDGFNEKAKDFIEDVGDDASDIGKEIGSKFAEIGKIGKNVGDWIDEVVDDAGEKVTNFADAVNTTITNATKDANAWLKGINEATGDLLEDVGEGAEKVGAAIGEFLTDAYSWVKNTGEKTKETVDQIESDLYDNAGTTWKLDAEITTEFLYEFPFVSNGTLYAKMECKKYTGNPDYYLIKYYTSDGEDKTVYSSNRTSSGFWYEDSYRTIIVQDPESTVIKNLPSISGVIWELKDTFDANNLGSEYVNADFVSNNENFERLTFDIDYGENRISITYYTDKDNFDSGMTVYDSLQGGWLGDYKEIVVFEPDERTTNILNKLGNSKEKLITPAKTMRGAINEQYRQLRRMQDGASKVGLAEVANKLAGEENLQTSDKTTIGAINEIYGLIIGGVNVKTWLLHDTLELYENLTYDFEFTSNGISYNQMIYSYTQGSGDEDDNYYLRYKTPEGTYTSVYQNGWTDTAYQTITTTDDISLDSIATLQTEDEEEIDLSAYQTKTDETLETTSKEIAGAINEVNDKTIPIVTTGTSSAYEATVNGITELKAGINFIMIPHINSSAITATLNVNGLGAKYIKRMVSDGNVIAFVNNYRFFKQNKPYRVIYSGSEWILEDYIQASATDLYGRVPVNSGGVPQSSTSNANQILRVNEEGAPVWSDETTGGEVDTSNLATVDKITSVDTWYWGASSVSDDGDGISWNDGFCISDENGEVVQGQITQKIPLVAGENVTFSYDEENNAIAINATGGGSSTPSVSLIGTWTVIDEPEIPTTEMPLVFTSNGENFTALGFAYVGSSSWGINSLSYINDGTCVSAYINNPSGDYGITHGWGNEAYKTLTVTEEPTDANAIAWLGANTDAPKVSTSKPCLEMPQIRFTSAVSEWGQADNSKGITGVNMLCDDDNPLYFNVEIVGGGALQVGDTLQLCTRKGFMGSEANGYRAKYKLRKFAEYEITEEDLDKKYLTVATHRLGNSVPKELYHDGNAGQGNTLSPIYIRIRRPKGDLQNNDSGKTVDATFSNIVTVWKLHYREARQIKIL